LRRIPCIYAVLAGIQIRYLTDPHVGGNSTVSPGGLQMMENGLIQVDIDS